MKLQGSIVALVTPFTEDLKVNFEVLDQLIDFHLQNKTSAISILGTTGEAANLSLDEQKEIVAFVVEKVAGRLHINVGAGSNSSQKALELSKIFEDLGADSLLHVTPYYNKPTEKGLIKHFSLLADNLHIPIILYNVPQRTGVSLSPKAVGILAKHKNIMGIKEASGDMSYAMELSQHLTDDFALYSGNDDLILPLLSIGASGVISVWANIMPKEVADLVDSFKENKDKTLLLQKKYLPLIKALFSETNPIPIKFALNYIGYVVGDLRLPLEGADETTKVKIIQELERLK